MIEQGDHVMVCISGGKDSFTLLDLLVRLKMRAPIDFSLTAVNLDQNQPTFHRSWPRKYRVRRTSTYMQTRTRYACF